MCAFSSPSSRFACLSQVTSFQKHLHITCPVQLCDHIWVNGTRVPDRYCGEANLMLLPVCTLNFVLGNKHTFLKNLLGRELVNLWCIVSVAHWVTAASHSCCYHMLLLTIFLCSHVKGTGTEWKYYIAENCWLFAQLVGFVILPDVPCCCILFL